MLISFSLEVVNSNILITYIINGDSQQKGSFALTLPKNLASDLKIRFGSSTTSFKGSINNIVGGKGGYFSWNSPI